MDTAVASRSVFIRTRVHVSDASRIIPSRYDQAPLLDPLAADAPGGLAAVNELDSATNPRVTRNRPCLRQPDFLLPNNELLHSHIVNGAFAHGSPHARFSSPTCGVWYSSDTTIGAQAEVVFNKERELSDLGENVAQHYPQSVRYTEWLASYSGPLDVLDATASNAAAIMDPASYRVSQAVGEDLRMEGSLGIVYPAVRHPGATNHAIFIPAVVADVRLAHHWQLTIDASGHSWAQAGFEPDSDS